MNRSARSIAIQLAGLLASCAAPATMTVPRPAVDGEAPVLSPEEALRSFRMPPGYHLELVAAEPLVQDPVAIQFDPDGRLWVVEMRGYMPNVEGKGEGVPVGRVVVLEDRNRDGRMDRGTVFLDSLVLPRALAVLEHGVLIAETPRLWLARDTTGDLRADTKTLLRDDFGDPESNPEHNANGLLWGLDNWIHNARFAGEFRFRGDSLELRAAPRLGQWGVSQDDEGRLYRNYNEDPLHVDLVPSHYYARNAAQARTRGAYEPLTANTAVWPAHPTPAVNRGYRPGVLRDDSTLAKFTSAGAPTVYRGDRLPAELRGNVFVTEPAGNLVHRFVLVDSAGTPRARSAYQGSEFLASTDTRFRPVNLATAPDGTLYVVDMYRGIIQHRTYITPYLAAEIRAKGLEMPLGMGRIYRVAHDGMRPAPAPRLSGASGDALVRLLSHPNGWWRTTAQRLLVERGDRSTAPRLRELARSAPSELTRLHALWTLEGLAEADGPSLVAALADRSPAVRAAAMRIAEPALAHGDAAVTAAFLRLAGDGEAEVRRQFAASAGELPAERREAVLAGVLEHAAGDPITVDAAISGLAGREMAVLKRVLADASPDAARDVVPALAATVMRAGRPVEVEALLGWTAQEGSPAWQRLALLEGVRLSAPQSETGRLLSVPFAASPDGLIAASRSSDPQVRTLAAQVLAAAEWPGRAGSGTPALAPADHERFLAGQRSFNAICAACHQPSGMGLPGVAKRLVGSPWVLGSPAALIRIVLEGKEGEMLMPPMGSLPDDQLAAVLTYVRNQWGNRASPITPAQVADVRAQTAGRTRPWTEQELAPFTR